MVYDFGEDKLIQLLQSYLVAFYVVFLDEVVDLDDDCFLYDFMLLKKVIQKIKKQRCRLVGGCLLF